jgi:hypothetical protein
MKVAVQVIYQKGRSMAAATRSKAATYKGQLRIREARISELGRMATVADLISTTDGCDGTVLPALHDVNVIYVDAGKMRIRGFEIVEGAHYAQTWDMKVA